MSVETPLSAQTPRSRAQTPSPPLRLHPIAAADLRPHEDRCFVGRVPLEGFVDPPIEGTVHGAVLEDGAILGPPTTTPQQIARRGAGRYQLWRGDRHEHVTVLFSTSDGSDPRTNGRRYAVLTQPLSFANDWDHWQQRRWLNHSRGRYFLRRGGTEIPPPLFANLGITDLCNLKCGICGSQNMAQPVNRRFMDPHVFRQVADTLFPLLVTVELNSRGEPLLHPQMPEMLETILDHGIFLRVQTNGTQFTDRRLALLARQTGEVSVSIDATGALFEHARAGARWEQVDRGVRDLLAARERDRLGVSLYPTLTGRTIEGAEALLAWAMEIGVDRVDFHQYDPIEASAEARPTPAQLEALRAHAASRDPAHPIEIRLDYEVVKPGTPPLLPTPIQQRHPNIPRRADADGAHPVYTCMAPVQLVDIDLDGGVCVCCFLQERRLGNALTPEAFADCWFGAEYRAVRASLERASATGPLYETCRGCVARYTA